MKGQIGPYFKYQLLTCSLSYYVIGCSHLTMSVEQQPIPDWATHEREKDLGWIQQNLEIFWQTARKGAVVVGRGALVVDVAVKPMGEENYFTYISQADIERFEDEESLRLIQQYEPETEFVIMLLKLKERTSSYQIRPFTDQ